MSDPESQRVRESEGKEGTFSTKKKARAHIYFATHTEFVPVPPLSSAVVNEEEERYLSRTILSVSSDVGTIL